MDAPREVVSEGYTRDRHWEIVHHDIVDLLGQRSARMESVFGLPTNVLSNTIRNTCSWKRRGPLIEICWPLSLALGKSD
jgi:hypothetical protein